MEERKKELLSIFEKVDDEAIKKLSFNLIDNITFLEDRLNYLRQFPFIKVNPKDPTQQKTTPAGKQYKELLASYMNSLRVLQSFLKNEDVAEASNLQQWIQELKEGI
jgi:hypothetical protein